MSNKLVVLKKELVVSKTQDLNEYLKPLSRDILLFTTNISSTYKLKDKKPLFDLKVKDTLNFKHHKSEFDDNEISILNEEGKLVGYVPESEASIFAKLMDNGKKLFAVVNSVSLTQSLPLIQIDIFLKDF